MQLSTWLWAKPHRSGLRGWVTLKNADVVCSVPGWVTQHNELMCLIYLWAAQNVAHFILGLAAVLCLFQTPVLGTASWMSSPAAMEESPAAQRSEWVWPELPAVAQRGSPGETPVNCAPCSTPVCTDPLTSFIYSVYFQMQTCMCVSVPSAADYKTLCPGGEGFRPNPITVILEGKTLFSLLCLKTTRWCHWWM